jgi:hypothetical protein
MQDGKLHKDLQKIKAWIGYFAEYRPARAQRAGRFYVNLRKSAQK